ncbi:unnamed protein product [Chondrus crispus]|uniref:Uncharacterized protein n=1 Tax=Chondrus crispus TaxID=2769 RepID=R7Q109_CHOCR|nr:unnamed protein product [Chondrus crispus]CDF32327.1 unnamed protein product [Chondrus crispus]|eukprot:XP_005711992.1 unnamed protein product [Chondrus crispus]
MPHRSHHARNVKTTHYTDSNRPLYIPTVIYEEPHNWAGRASSSLARLLTK